MAAATAASAIRLRHEINHDPRVETVRRMNSVTIKVAILKGMSFQSVIT